MPGWVALPDQLPGQGEQLGGSPGAASRHPNRPGSGTGAPTRRFIFRKIASGRPNHCRQPADQTRPGGYVRGVGGRQERTGRKGPEMGRLTAVVAWGLGSRGDWAEHAARLGGGAACLGRPARYRGRASQLYRTVAARGPGCSPGGVAPRPGPAGDFVRGGSGKGPGGRGGGRNRRAGTTRPAGRER